MWNCAAHPTGTAFASHPDAPPRQPDMDTVPRFDAVKDARLSLYRFSSSTGMSSIARSVNSRMTTSGFSSSIQDKFHKSPAM